jgi:hypothetical protein
MASGDTVLSVTDVALTRNLAGELADTSAGDSGTVVQVGFFGRFTQGGNSAWVHAQEFTVGVESTSVAPTTVFDSAKTYDIVIKEH